MKNVAELVGKPARIKVKDTWNHKWPLPETLMGIEVEVERLGSTFPDLMLRNWDRRHDGSLQDGVEFVLARPMAGVDLRAAIHELFNGSRFSRSFTGSTHIHMDMLEDETDPEVLRTMVMLVYVLEPLLYASGDSSRRWCGYANPLMAGPDVIVSAVMNPEFSSDDFRRTYGRNNSTIGRYYGLNMAALVDYGSLEFRYFPTATSEEELLGWIELVQTFKLAAIEIGNKERLTDIVEDEDAFYNFLGVHFGKWAHLFSSLGEYYEIRNNYRKAIITASIGVARPSKKYVDFSKILKGTKLESLLKVPLKDTPTKGRFDVVWVGSADPIPSENSFDDTTFMVFNGRIYYTNNIHRSEAEQYLITSRVWAEVAHDRYSVHYDHRASFAGTLEYILQESEAQGIYLQQHAIDTAGAVIRGHNEDMEDEE